MCGARSHCAGTPGSSNAHSTPRACDTLASNFALSTGMRLAASVSGQVARRRAHIAPRAQASTQGVLGAGLRPRAHMCGPACDHTGPRFG